MKDASHYQAKALEAMAKDGPHQEAAVNERAILMAMTSLEALLNRIETLMQLDNEFVRAWKVEITKLRLKDA